MEKLKTISFPNDELGDTFRSHGLKPKTWYNVVSKKFAYNDIYYKVEGIDCYIPSILVLKTKFILDNNEVDKSSIFNRIIKWIKKL